MPKKTRLYVYGVLFGFSIGISSNQLGVLDGNPGLQFAEGTRVFAKNEGFIVPANTKVRIFNAGASDLHLIEVLRPAYTEQRAEVFDSF